MNCACGIPMDTDSDPCSTCGLVRKDCPSCGVHLSVVASAIIPSCPFCDAPFQQDSGCEAEYFPVHVSSAEVCNRLQQFVQNRFGIPKDFAAQYRVSKTDLVYVPIRVYSVEAWLASNICEVETFALSLHAGLWYEQYLATHRFSLRSKVFFPKDSDCTVYSKDRSEPAVVEQVETFGKKLEKADRSWFSPGTTQPLIKSEVLGEILYPLYEMEYTYGERAYKAVVDASNGVVCCAGYPMNYESRTRLLTSAALMFGVTVLLSFIFGTTYVSNFSDMAGINVFVVGLIVSVRLLYTGLKRPMGQEVTANPSSRLDLAGVKLSFSND